MLIVFYPWVWIACVLDVYWYFVVVLSFMTVCLQNGILDARLVRVLEE